jgi:hypothetical protein
MDNDNGVQIKLSLNEYCLMFPFISVNWAKAPFLLNLCPLAEANGNELNNSLPSLLRDGQA